MNRRAICKSRYESAKELKFADYGGSVSSMEELVFDERRRELMFEGKRWYDLVRTQTWIERCSTYLMGEDYNKGDTMEKVWQRDIQKKHYIRPIPVGQLNGLDMEEAEIEAYQNPGYAR